MWLYVFADKFERQSVCLVHPELLRSIPENPQMRCPLFWNQMRWANYSSQPLCSCRKFWLRQESKRLLSNEKRIQVFACVANVRIYGNTEISAVQFTSQDKWNMKINSVNGSKGAVVVILRIIFYSSFYIALPNIYVHFLPVFVKIACQLIVFSSLNYEFI